MSLSMLNDLNQIRKLMAEASELKRIFDEFESAKVYMPDKSTIDAVAAAKKLLGQAMDCHVTVQLALEGLATPGKTEAELQQLVAQAKDHSSELGQFMDSAKALIGAEGTVLKGLIADHEAAKLAALSK
jgi:uncharacterized protein YhaN